MYYISNAVILSPFLGADILGFINPYMSRNRKETIKQPFNICKYKNPFVPTLVSASEGNILADLA